MTDEEREKRKAKRRLDPKRPLEYLIIERGVFEQMLEVTPRQCQDFAGICLYLMSHPLMGDFIPDAADWGKDKCARMLKIHGKIAADCALFRRETRAGNSGIACTLYPLDDAAKALEQRGIRRDAAMARWARGMHADACSNEQTKERGIEEEEEEKDIPLSQGVTFLHPPTPTQQAAPVVDGLEEGGLPQGGEIVEMKPNKPKDVQEVEKAARMMLPPGMADDAPRIAREFYNSNEAMGWTDEEGHPVQNWLNRLKRYCEICVDNAPRETQAHAPAAELSILDVRRIFEDEWKKHDLQAWEMDDCISAFMQGKGDGEWRDGKFGVIRDKAKAARAYARQCADAFSQHAGEPESENLPPTMDNARAYFRAWCLDEREQARAAHDFMEYLYSRGYFSNDGVKRLYWKHAAHDFAVMRYTRPAAPAAPTMPVGACPRPTLAEVAEALSRRWPFDGRSQDSLEAHAREFLAWMDGRGWRKKTGEPIKDWKKSCLPVFVQKFLNERSKQ